MGEPHLPIVSRAEHRTAVSMDVIARAADFAAASDRNGGARSHRSALGQRRLPANLLDVTNEGHGARKNAPYVAGFGVLDRPPPLGQLFNPMRCLNAVGRLRGSGDPLQGGLGIDFIHERRLETQHVLGFAV